MFENFEVIKTQKARVPDVAKVVADRSVPEYPEWFNPSANGFNQFLAPMFRFSQWLKGRIENQ